MGPAVGFFGFSLEIQDRLIVCNIACETSDVPIFAWAAAASQRLSRAVALACARREEVLLPNGLSMLPMPWKLSRTVQFDQLPIKAI